ncbi:MAG: hypothetical protein R6W31_16485 [Bacteroidales bacterium]
MRKIFFILMICISFPLVLTGQGEIDEQRHTLFRDESTFAAFLNSNGFSVNYRHGYYRDARNQFLIDADFTYVKDPKEIKTQVVYDYNTRRYVFGKENLFWELKALAGWQSELYRKYDKNGISVRLFYEGGISLGFLKPIYYEVFTYSAIGEAVDREYLKFDPSIHQSQIGGRGPFFMGFNELSVVPGATVKAGLSFEYSQRDAVIHALEAGISLTLYPKKMTIMATDQNKFFFFNLSVGYRFGKIVDISEAARAKTGKQKREERKKQESTLPYPVY